MPSGDVLKPVSFLDEFVMLSPESQARIARLVTMVRQAEARRVEARAPFAPEPLATHRVSSIPTPATMSPTLYLIKGSSF